ncbi:MAG: YraN family protein [Minisyncoccota bacterium]
MTNNIKIGQIGEDLACQYLLDNKYKILNRNYRETWGEIDIIGKDQSGVLVFIEVKTLRVQTCLKMFHTSVKHSNIAPGLKPEDNLSQSKLNKVKRTAYLYANNHPELINDEMGWRIDLIAIEIDHSNPGTLNQKELAEFSTIRHYEGIVN